MGFDGLSVRFLGSGDAFGSGGRLQACIYVQAGDAHVLLDCGASSLVAMKRLGVEPNAIDAVVLTHLHGDHFGGLPFLLLDGQFSRRDRALLLAGPPSIRERVVGAMEVLFPGSSAVERGYQVRYVELAARAETPLVAPFSITAFEVPHPSGAPAYAVRLRAAGKVLAYSGDGSWSEALVEAARGADLFICEAYSFEKSVPHHLSYATLREHRARLDCRRLVLTHLGPDLLGRQSEVTEQLAEDGLAVVI